MPNFEYVIMSRNGLDGFLCGHFTKLDSLFLEDYNKDECGTGHKMKWTSNLYDAMRFHEEAVARDLTRNIWGLDFANQVLLVLSVHKDAFEASRRQHRDAKDVINKAATMTTGLQFYREAPVD
jgi:hypothetical protein